MIFMFSFSLTIIVSVCLLYNYMLSSVNKNDKKTVLFEISEGTTSKEIAKNLEEEGLIRSGEIFLVYLKLNNVSDIKGGYFELNKSMDVIEIVNEIRKNSTINPNSISLLFKEGITVRDITKIIDEETDNSSEDVYNLLNDKEYINSLVEKYWFLTNEIQNENIYYPLEGYLFPDTYNFDDKSVDVKDIFNKMLEKTDKVLNKYRKDIEQSNYTVHEVITLASITEGEGINYEDKQNIVSVFENRIAKKWSLGSDVTSYYASKIDMGERDLTNSELNLDNPYNTRGPNMEGKLPVGPVCNPSEQTIKSVLNSASTDYLFFVADKNRKVYFTKTSKEHEQIIVKLKSEDLWYEW